MRPFAETMTDVAHGMLITSATLRDKRETDTANMWDAAAARTGARHLGSSVDYAGVSSPFDYPAQTRVRVITDIAKDNNEQIAAAFRELILAAGGGVLGLFTSIARLRAVHARLADDPKLKHLTLLAQHVDPLDTGTLVDIFRAEEDACLFGTDAVRDGVDVPGHSLRMIVFDRVPWPRPTILHRARKQFFADFSYDDMMTRLKLKQAFGRLVRRADDRGMFVMLDKAMPSRLCDAFPEGVAVERAGLKDTLEAAREFFVEPRK
jgi:ATP-dependent DNA helicase DinG